MPRETWYALTPQNATPGTQVSYCDVNLWFYDRGTITRHAFTNHVYVKWSKLQKETLEYIPNLFGWTQAQ